MWLTRFAINRPVITAMVFIALAIFGIIAFTQIGRSANPPGTDFPIVVVYANYPGASPQEMERLSSSRSKISSTASTISISSARPRKKASRSVIVQFKLGTDLDLAAINVQNAVDTARVYMPADLDPPSVDKNGASQPLARHRRELELALADAACRYGEQPSRADPQGDSERSDASTSSARPTASSTSSRSPDALSAPTRRCSTSSTRSRRTTPTCRAASCAAPTQETTSRFTPKSTARTTSSAFRCRCPAAPNKH